MVSSKLFVEGGGDSKTLKTASRKGFRTFIENAGLEKQRPRIVACGSRTNAYRDFRNEHNSAPQEGGSALLLVDAEGPVREEGPWQHLKAHEGWARPANAMDNQCYLMVEVMESWFLADRQALIEFYGQGYRAAALPANQNIEQISKQDVLNGLILASRDTKRRSL